MVKYYVIFKGAYNDWRYMSDNMLHVDPSRQELFKVFSELEANQFIKNCKTKGYDVQLERIRCSI